MTNVLLRDLDNAADGRWLELVADGLPLKPNLSGGAAGVPHDNQRAKNAPVFKNTTKIQREDLPEKEEKSVRKKMSR